MAVPFLRRSPDESVSKDAEPMLEYEKAAWTVKSLFATEGTEYTELVPPPPASTIGGYLLRRHLGWVGCLECGMKREEGKSIRRFARQRH
jgi:hypothetical protein